MDIGEIFRQMEDQQRTQQAMHILLAVAVKRLGGELHVTEEEYQPLLAGGIQVGFEDGKYYARSLTSVDTVKGD